MKCIKSKIRTKIKCSRQTKSGRGKNVRAIQKLRRIVKLKIKIGI